MKKILTLILAFILFISSFNSIYAAIDNCKPSWNWNWTMSNSCNWPNGYKIFWNINVWEATLYVWPWVDMWIDLAVNNISFWNYSISKMIIDTTAKIANHVFTRYYEHASFPDGWYGWTSGYWVCTWTNEWACYWETSPKITKCNPWMHVFNDLVVPTDPAIHYMITDDTRVYVTNSWDMYCWVRAN